MASASVFANGVDHCFLPKVADDRHAPHPAEMEVGIWILGLVVARHFGNRRVTARAAP